MASTTSGVDSRVEDMEIDATSKEVQDNINHPTSSPVSNPLDQIVSEPTQVGNQLEVSPQVKNSTNGTDPIEVTIQKQALCDDSVDPMPDRVGTDTYSRNGSPAATQIAVSPLPGNIHHHISGQALHVQPQHLPQPPNHPVGTQHHQPQNRPQVLPVSHSGFLTMANIINADGWKNQSAYGDQITGYDYTHSPARKNFSSVFPQSDAIMNQAAKYPGQSGVNLFFRQYSYPAQPSQPGAPNSYSDSNHPTYSNMHLVPRDHLPHTGYQNMQAGTSSVDQQFSPHFRDSHLPCNHGFDQFTSSTATFRYDKNYQYQALPSQQQSVENRPLECHQQHTHYRASTDGGSNQFNDEYSGEAHGIGNGEDRIADSVFGDVSGEGSGSRESNHEHQSRHERLEMFVHDSDDDGNNDHDDDNGDNSLQARRHRQKCKGVVRNDNRNGSSGVPRGTNAGFASPGGTASEYRPSRWSGVPIQKTPHNQTPETKDGRYVSDASLKKRGLHRVMKNRVAKRASGANDPENLKIVQLYDNHRMSYEEIAQVINDDRRKQGRAPDLTGNAVSARYTRTAPILYKAEGKPWLPPSKRKGAITGPVSIWNADLDLKMVKIKQEVDATTWQQVAERFNRETGNDFTIEQISTRWAAI